jgi:hypothetical protein
MSIDSAHDPRSALVKTKFFSLHPKPLERWLWKQGLPPAAERVFWFHWEAGMRNGNWCSEIPLKRVALECCIDLSTVTRSYQVLKAKGLIRREDPGRDLNNPFQQATAVTEVRLPREFVVELSRTPNRPLKVAVKEPLGEAAISLDSRSRDGDTAPADGPTGASASVTATSKTETASRRPNRADTKAMWSRASATEHSRFYAASRDRLTSLEFDPDTRLTPEDRGQILAQLAQLAAARPTPNPAKVTRPAAAHVGPRRVPVLEMARTRRLILDTVPGSGGAEILRQVIWAVEEGSLRRFELRLAINIALKKIREGSWSRPHRMPPNWMPTARTVARAVPEQCSAA